MIQSRFSGHMSYTDAKGVVGWALDQLCGGGGGEAVHERSRFVAQGSAVAWLEIELGVKRDGEYLKWAMEEASKRDGLISKMEVKE